MNIVYWKHPETQSQRPILDSSDSHPENRDSSSLQLNAGWGSRNSEAVFFAWVHPLTFPFSEIFESVLNCSNLRKQGPQFDLIAWESSYDLWLALALCSIPQNKVQSVERILRNNMGFDPTSEYLEKCASWECSIFFELTSLPSKRKTEKNLP